jgi:hypothetical protein
MGNKFSTSSIVVKHFSILAISPVSFSLLEILQKFIHGPFSPNAPDVSAVNEGDLAGEANAPQVLTRRIN